MFAAVLPRSRGSSKGEDHVGLQVDQLLRRHPRIRSTFSPASPTNVLCAGCGRAGSIPTPLEPLGERSEANPFSEDRLRLPPSARRCPARARPAVPTPPPDKAAELPSPAMNSRRLIRSPRRRSATLSAGTSMPSVLAVCMLMTNSNLVDCTTGRSAGLRHLSGCGRHIGQRRSWLSALFAP